MKCLRAALAALLCGPMLSVANAGTFFALTPEIAQQTGALSPEGRKAASPAVSQFVTAHDSVTGYQRWEAQCK